MRIATATNEAQWLLRDLRPYTAKALCALVLATAAGLVSTLDPLLMRHLIDRSLPSRRLCDSLVCVALIALCFIGRSMLSGLGGLVGFRVAQRFGQDLKQELLAHMTRLSADWHERVMLGEKLSRLDTDVDEIAQFGADAVNTIVRVVIFFGLNLVIMLKLNVAMTLSVLPLLPVFYLVRWKFKPLMQTRANEAQAGIGRTSGRIAEHLGAVPQLHLLGADQSRLADSVNAWSNVVSAQWSQRRTEVAFGVSITSVLGVAILLVLGIGSEKFSVGALTLGTIVAFYAYVTRIFEPISTAMDFYARSERMLASARRVREIMIAEPAVPDSGRVSLIFPRLRHGIVVRGVSFQYTEERSALRNIDLEFSPGETVAIIGPSGSGKSTLARLFVRLADPTRGSILVEGRSAQDYTLRALREIICYVPQSPVLFRGTIRENLLLAKPSATKRELDTVIDVAQLKLTLQRLSRGLDHTLDAGATGLSGGEQQRLAIARALLRPSAVLILDEASSALDLPTETTVLQAIRQFRRERILVVISHRVKSLTWVDRFVLLERGSISAEGDHARMWGESHLFRALVESEAPGVEGGFMEHGMAYCEKRQMDTAELKAEGIRRD
jgi:ABC-type bacteriocin/lantibiotic exporter with double-glycine peptidase domain